MPHLYNEQTDDSVRSKINNAIVARNDHNNMYINETINASEVATDLVRMGLPIKTEWERLRCT